MASSSVEKVEGAVKRLDSSKVSGRTVDVFSENSLGEFFKAIGSIDHLVYTAGDTLQLGPLEKVKTGVRSLHLERWSSNTLPIILIVLKTWPT